MPPTESPSETPLKFSYVNDPTNWNTSGIECAFVCATNEDAKKAEALFNGLLAQLAEAEKDAARYVARRKMEWGVMRQFNRKWSEDTWIAHYDGQSDAARATETRE